MATMYPNSPHGRVHLSDPADLIAAVPALLGFRPHRSLVVICLGGVPATVQAVMRHDLAGTASNCDRLSVDRLAALCERAGAASVIVVVVDDRAHGDGPIHDLHHALVDLLSASLAEVGVALAGAHAVTGIETGAQWWGLLGDPRHGTVPDPTASAVAVAQVIRGRPIRASRLELERILEPRPRADRDRVARLLALARHPTSRARPRSVRSALEDVLARIASSDGALSDEGVAAIAVALEAPAVRDSVLALAITELADAAERAWIVMARALSGPARAEPAALLGFSAYARGDGPLAGVALTAALDADPGHRLAGLLDDALHGGIRPDVIVDLARTGRDVARTLGVTLPPAA
ncbi:DUF4192 domain-containing protein [Rhodococcus sp. NPDC003348]